ncbi:MAG: phosphotransferase [Nitrospiraceae bacterium]|nr:phosphotransferase [Nitrospiraceae bacterium]
MLAGFTHISRGGAEALVREEWADVVSAALVEGEGCHPAGEGGRGALMRFAYPNGSGLVRRYRRGGVIRHFLKESYLLQNRPLRELGVHAFLQDEGLSVPVVLGAAWQRRGLWYRGAIASDEIASTTLLEYARERGAQAERVMDECGQLIRRMHELGVYHADLQVKNILIGEDRAYLIDFDNASRLPVVSDRLRARNLLRLRRSFEKHDLPGPLFRALCAGYGADAFPRWLDRLYRAKGTFSDYVSR